MADVTRCKHNVTGHQAELPTGALAAYIARGWEPITDSRPMAQAEAERIAAEEAAAAAPVPRKNESPRSTPVARRNQINTNAGDAGDPKES